MKLDTAARGYKVIEILGHVWPAKGASQHTASETDGVDDDVSSSIKSQDLVLC